VPFFNRQTQNEGVLVAVFATNSKVGVIAGSSAATALKAPFTSTFRPAAFRTRTPIPRYFPEFAIFAALIVAASLKYLRRSASIPSMALSAALRITLTSTGFDATGCAGGLACTATQMDSAARAMRNSFDHKKTLDCFL
jgi:hypothetical protein